MDFLCLIISFQSMRPNRDLIDLLKLKNEIQIRKWKNKKAKCPAKSPMPYPHSSIKKFYFTDSKETDADKISDSEILPKDKESNAIDRLCTASREEKVDQSQLKVAEKHTHNSRQKHDVLARLKVIANEVPAAAKTDVDPGFFSVIGGRPTRKRFIRREYIEKLNEILFVKAASVEMTSHLEDVKINVFKSEQLHDRVHKMVNFHHLQSSDCMYKEFDKTMDVNEKLKEAKARRSQSFQRRKALRSNVHQIRTRLYKMEEYWRILKVYQCFLYQISPLRWRFIFDNINTHDRKLIVGNFPSIFGAHRLKSIGEFRSLEDLLQDFTRTAFRENRPVLYFTHPKQLKSHFDYMKSVNAHGYEYLKQLRDTANEVRGYCVELIKAYERKMMRILNDYQTFTEALLWLIDRKDQLYKIAMEKEDDLKKSLLSKHNYKVRSNVWEGSEPYVGFKELFANITIILDSVQQDANEIMREYSMLPPAVVKLAFKSVDKKIKLIGEAHKNAKRLQRLEKTVTDAFTMKTVPKYKVRHKDRSFLPSTKKAKDIIKADRKPKDEFYTEDIFNNVYELKGIDFGRKTEMTSEEIRACFAQILSTNYIDSEEEDIDLYESLHKETGSILELSDVDSTSSISAASIPSTSSSSSSSTSGVSSTTKSSEPLDEVESKHERVDSASDYPNGTLEFPPIDLQELNIEKKILQTKKLRGIVYKQEEPKNKPGMTAATTDIDETTAIENILLKKETQTAEKKGQSAIEDEDLGNLQLGMGETKLRKQSRTRVSTDRKVAAMNFRWKNAVSLRNEKSSTKNKLIKQKLQRTSKKHFHPKVEDQSDVNFIQSPYIPALETLTEKPARCQKYTGSLNFTDSQLDLKLRKYKQCFYKGKSYAALCHTKRHSGIIKQKRASKMLYDHASDT